MLSRRIQPMLWLSMAISVPFATNARAQDTAPDPLITTTGIAVTTRSTFEHQRRPEILRMFEENVYGETPSTHLPLHIVSVTKDETALRGMAIRKQINVSIGEQGKIVMHILLYRPKSASRPVPVIVGLNFAGNQTINPDPGIAFSPVWVPDKDIVTGPIANERAPHKRVMPDERSRGAAAAQWQVEMLVKRGYGLATMYAGDVDPDFDGALGLGVRPLFFRDNQRLPEAETWGAIGAWAWAMSRIVDVLADEQGIDPQGFIAFGFSRFGKAALWASAQDTRFAVTLSNESGQAGATLSRNGKGESIDHMMLAFPYWFSPNYQHYLGRIAQMPVDGDLLLSLIAPRALYIGSAIADPFSDPEGEFLAARSVSRVYALYGLKGVDQAEMPGLSQSIGDRVAYHVRPGGHDVTAYDWQQYLNFADRQLSKFPSR